MWIRTSPAGAEQESDQIQRGRRGEPTRLDPTDYRGDIRHYRPLPTLLHRSQIRHSVVQTDERYRTQFRKEDSEANLQCILHGQPEPIHSGGPTPWGSRRRDLSVRGSIRAEGPVRGVCHAGITG